VLLAEALAELVDVAMDRVADGGPQVGDDEGHPADEQTGTEGDEGGEGGTADPRKARVPRVLPTATERILSTVPDSASVLDVGGWAAPFNRADWVIDVMPHATRGAMGSYGPGPERFSEDTWVIQDICDRDPWPFADDQFDFAICVTTLEDIRDPIGVCRELSRVARAGYVEVPTVEAELMYDVQGIGPWLGHLHHRWFCDHDPEHPGGLVFWHKPHSIHHDWRLRVLPRWQESMTLEDELFGVFWEGEIHARERIVIHDDPTELIERVRARFEPSAFEIRAKEARDRAQRAVGRVRMPLRRAVEKLIGR
jgi:hypothetical protein